MTTTSVLQKTRRLLGDFGETFVAQIAGDGQTIRFELPENVVDTIQAVLIPAGGGTPVVLTAGTDYTVDPYNGIVITAIPPALGAVLTVAGMFYESWTDTDLLDYIDTAFALHTVTRNPPVYLDPIAGTYPPTLVIPVYEERCVVLLAAKAIVQDQASAAAKDITIDTGDGTVIPRSVRYTQLVQEANRLDDEYQDLVDKLGLPGFDTLTVLDLQRVSLQTNRLVPLYIPREWDTRTYPQRVLTQINTGALSADRVITYRGQWSYIVQYNIDDLVDEGGIRYICTTPNQTTNPATDVAAGPNLFDGLFWSVSYINSGVPGWVGAY